MADHVSHTLEVSVYSRKLGQTERVSESPLKEGKGNGNSFNQRVVIQLNQLSSIFRNPFRLIAHIHHNIHPLSHRIRTAMTPAPSAPPPSSSGSISTRCSSLPPHSSHLRLRYPWLHIHLITTLLHHTPRSSCFTHAPPSPSYQNSNPIIPSSQ
jgi:hypothetical protein